MDHLKISKMVIIDKLITVLIIILILIHTSMDIDNGPGEYSPVWCRRGSPKGIENGEYGADNGIDNHIDIDNSIVTY